MSFQMKYDKHGNPLPNPEMEALYTATPEQPPVEKAMTPEPVQQTIETAAPEEAPIVEQPQEQTSELQQQVEESPQDVNQKYQWNAQQKNMKELRERAQYLERERDEYLRKLQEREAQSRPIQQQVESDDDYGIQDNDLAEGKHLKKLHSEIKKLRQEAEAIRQQNTYTATEIKLKAQYPDFDQVVSAESIAELNATEPELAATIGANQDVYTKAVSAYKMIKKLGIYRDTQQPQQQQNYYSQDKRRIEQNMQKPRPTATIAPQRSNSPLTEANAFEQGLTPELKARLVREMEEARRNF